MPNSMSTIDPDVLLCRDLRHQWEYAPYRNTIKGSGSSRVLTRVLTCLRCGTERTDVISLTTYRVLSRSYYYPPTYQVPGGIAFAELRQESVRRMVKQTRTPRTLDKEARR